MAAVLLFSATVVEAQRFETPTRSSFISNTFIDPDLPQDECYGTIVDGNDKWDVYYYYLISAPRASTNDFGSPITVISTDKKTGKTTKYRKFENPSVYYAILRNGDTRFYGLVTTGYDNIETVLKQPKSEWHPFTEVKPFMGTLILPDGSTEDFRLHRESEWKAKAVKAPVGTLIRYGFPEYDGAAYDKVTLQFNPGGTGTITLTHRPYAETFMTYMGGSLKQKVGNRVKRKANVVHGGTIRWMNTGKRPMKWSLQDGKLTITPTGTVTMTYKEEIDQNEGNTHWSSEADRQTSKRQQEYDLKYVNEDAIAGRERVKKNAKEADENFPAFTIDVEYLTKDELLGSLNGSTVHLSTHKQGEMDFYEPQLYVKLDQWKRTANNKRDNGSELRYNEFVRKTKLAVLRDKERFGEPADYSVSDYDFSSPTTVKAKMTYYRPNEQWQGEYTINSKGAIEMTPVKLDPFGSGNKEIEELNTAIMAYKNDKARKDVVKKYEKSYKNFVKNFKPVFNSEATLKAVLDEQNRFINSQKETLKLLE